MMNMKVTPVRTKEPLNYIQEKKEGRQQWDFRMGNCSKNFEYFYWNMKSHVLIQPRSYILSSVLFPYYFSGDIQTTNSGREKTSPFTFGLPPYNCFASTGSATSLRNGILDSIGRLMLNVHSTDYRLHPKDGEGTVFTRVCLSTPGGGRVPSHRFFPRSLVPGPFWEVPQLQVLSQVLSGGYPSPGWGGGNMNRFSPAPSRSGWGLGTPRPVQDAIPPVQVRMGYRRPPGQNSRASICYAACGMPLEFTQDDFLVLKCILFDRLSLQE